MSVRSSRRLKNSPAALGSKNESLTPKRSRKIRKTMDLICFDTTIEDITKKTGYEDQENKPPSSCKRTPKLKTLKEADVPKHFVLAPLPPVNENRKIVKAKRLLKSAADDKPVSGVIEAKSSEILVTTLPSPISPSAADDGSSQLVATTPIPSPISPSNNNTFNSDSLLLSKHLHFNSSKEDLHPSTNGTVDVDAPRRRTYELEDSVIDLSVLKTVSEEDSSRINSLPSSECETPTDAKFAKVTLRRKWDKMQDVSYKSSPNWINKKLKKSLSPLVQPETNNARKLSKTLSPRQPTSSTKKFVSKVKVPNFAAIHQKVFDKMESISEYKVRKEKRAIRLMSGKKPEVVAPTSLKESRKQLRFAPDTSAKEKSPTFIPLPSTPLPKKRLTVGSDSPSTPPVPFKWQLSKVERFDCFKPNNKTSPQLQKPVPKTKAIYKEFNFQSVKTEVFQPVNKVSVFQKEEIKNFMKKSKSDKNTVETRRYAIKGVRSNRRFELLMNMRKGK